MRRYTLIRITDKLGEPDHVDIGNAVSMDVIREHTNSYLRRFPKCVYIVVHKGIVMKVCKWRHTK